MDCFVALLLAMTRTETIMLNHENRVRDEFTRQAATFSASPAITDAALTQRFVDALGEAARGSVLEIGRASCRERVYLCV